MQTIRSDSVVCDNNQGPNILPLLLSILFSDLILSLTFSYRI